ncbi:hypothetical protein BGW37DRAFT_502979 [Umbelopsis sp. PMI_123]|nr:hypothetical protein BGW37DRAFT_502979 [Umbelopsis sp. PMI_123]
MDRMTNHEYDQQYRRHMDKLQAQAQYINDLLRYSSLQDQPRSAPHRQRQYHSRHIDVPLPRHPRTNDQDEDDISEIVVPVKPAPKPLKPILRRTVSSTVATTQPQPSSVRRRPISANQALANQFKERSASNDVRKVRIQEAQHIAYYPYNNASDGEEDDDEEEDGNEEEEEELWHDERQTYRQPTYQHERQTYRQPTHQHQPQYQNESEDNDTDSSSSNEPYVRPSPTWGRSSLPSRPTNQNNNNNTANYRYSTQRLNNYLNEAAVYIPANQRQQQTQTSAAPEQSPQTANNAVTSMLEQFFTTSSTAPVPSSTVSSPLSLQSDTPSFQLSPRAPSYSSSTTASNSSISKGFLSSIFRKGPTSPGAPNIITTRPPQRPNAKRSELLSQQDMAEIRESARYDMGEVRSSTPAKDRKTIKLASLPHVWCFRIWTRQQQLEEETPVWTAFDYSNQKKLTKGLTINKECVFRDSHLQGDVVVLPARNTGQVFEGNNSVLLEVRQIYVQADTMFVYREGVKT